MYLFELTNEEEKKVIEEYKSEMDEQFIARLSMMDISYFKALVERTKDNYNIKDSAVSALKRLFNDNGIDAITSNTQSTSDIGKPDIRKDGNKEYITFGSYRGYALTWDILDYSSDKKRALVLCRNVVENIPYNEESEEITWENCTLRKWLNEDFYKNAFTDSERARIVLSKITNPDNDVYVTEGGNDTEDRLFLLSLQEIDKYFPGGRQKVSAKRIRITFDGNIACWWLRSPGFDSFDAATVGFEGDVLDLGLSVELNRLSVCPAFWINLTP